MRVTRLYCRFQRFVVGHTDGYILGHITALLLVTALGCRSQGFVAGNKVSSRVTKLYCWFQRYLSSVAWLRPWSHHGFVVGHIAFVVSQGFVAGNNVSSRVTRLYCRFQRYCRRSHGYVLDHIRAFLLVTALRRRSLDFVCHKASSSVTKLCPWS